MSSDINKHSMTGVYMCTYTCTLMHMHAFPLVLHDRGMYACIHMHTHAQPHVTHDRVYMTANTCIPMHTCAHQHLLHDRDVCA